MLRAKFLSVWLTVVPVVLMADGTMGGVSNQQAKISELIQKLGQPTCQDAVGALVGIGEPAVEPLIRTLKDRSAKTWIVQTRIIDALAKIRTPQAVAVVVQSLKDADLNQYVRGSAAMAVADLKPEGAIEALAGTLEDKSQIVRWKSVQALGRLGDRQGASALIRVLKDEDQYVRAAAVKSLQQIKAENAEIALVEALNDDSWLVRLNSRQALAETDERAFEPLIKALKSTNSRIQWQAAWVLGRTKMEEAIEPLIESLADPDWMVRDEAAVALARINSRKAVEHLAKAMKHQNVHVRRQAAWVLDTMKADKSVNDIESRDAGLADAPPDTVYCGHNVYPCYPEMLDTKPDIPSPHTTLHGAEIVTALMKDGKYALIPVTVENGRTLDYRQNLWGKGRQLQVDVEDFPTLARTGLHSDVELNQTKTITGRSIVEITEMGRPGRSSGVGFLSHDEDILFVLKGDNRLVKGLGLKHPQMAKPLFHVWNMILRDYELGRLGRFWDRIEYILYHGEKVFLKAEGSRGWQESLFDDEVLGMYQFEVWRELHQDEKAFLRRKYAHLNEQQMAEFLKKLSYFHTGEMVPYYIMRYGFYEGHTDYRADPIAIGWIFGLRSLEQIETAFEGRLYEVLTQHFAGETAAVRH